MKKTIKLLILFLTVIFSFNFVYAEEELEETQENNYIEITSFSTTYNDGSIRNEYDNLGVNKKWEITDKNRDNVLSTPLVDSKLKVYDYAEILSEDDEKEIKGLIDKFIEHTNMDMVFVTINMPYYTDSKNEDYAADFYDYNDFGLFFDKYSGVLLLRNTYESDPYFNVYTFGEAQLYFDYDRCESMLDDIYNDFHNGSYVEGFKIFASDFTNYYNSGKALSDYYVDDMGYIHRDKGSFQIPYLTSGLIGGGVSLITILVLIGKNKMVKKANNAADYIDNSATNYNVKTDQFINTFTTRHRNSSDSGGGGFSSHGGSSGGGHGGGGGRHG